MTTLNTGVLTFSEAFGICRSLEMIQHAQTTSSRAAIWILHRSWMYRSNPQAPTIFGTPFSVLQANSLCVLDFHGVLKFSPHHGTVCWGMEYPIDVCRPSQCCIVITQVYLGPTVSFHPSLSSPVEHRESPHISFFNFAVEDVYITCLVYLTMEWSVLSIWNKSHLFG